MSESVWTDAAVAMLRQLHAEGLSFGLIGAAMGVSRNACIGKAGRLGLDKGPRVASGRKRKPRIRLVTTRPRTARHPIFDATPIEATDLPPDESPCAVTLMQLASCHYRWPCGTAPDGALMYCGADQVDGYPYCQRHAAMAYRRASDRMSKAEWELNGRRIRRETAQSADIDAGAGSNNAHQGARS